MGLPRVVVSDANVLINFLHVDRLDLFGALRGFDFVVIDEVVAEITVADQSTKLTAALERRWLRQERLDHPADLTRFVDLARTLGRGEAASLAWAIPRDCWLASDERRTFRREALQHLGMQRLINTPGLIVLAVRNGLLSITQADDIKAILERRRFKMPFQSFNDVL